MNLLQLQLLYCFDVPRAALSTDCGSDISTAVHHRHHISADNFFESLACSFVRHSSQQVENVNSAGLWHELGHSVETISRLPDYGGGDVRQGVFGLFLLTVC